MPLGLEYYDTTYKHTADPLVVIKEHTDMRMYKVYIANVTPIDCAHWLEYASIPEEPVGATITQGFGYWEGTLEPQCTVEMACDMDTLVAFTALIFEDTDERAVYTVGYDVAFASEVFRGPYDLKRKHEKSRD